MAAFNSTPMIPPSSIEASSEESLGEALADVLARDVARAKKEIARLTADLAAEKARADAAVAEHGKESGFWGRAAARATSDLVKTNRYAIALQRTIEALQRGEQAPDAERTLAPHHTTIADSILAAHAATRARMEEAERFDVCGRCGGRRRDGAHQIGDADQHEFFSAVDVLEAIMSDQREAPFGQHWERARFLIAERKRLAARKATP